MQLGRRASVHEKSGEARVQIPSLLRSCLHLSAARRAAAPLGWQFDPVVLGCPGLPQPLPRWHGPGLSPPPCRARGLPSRTHTAMVFQLSTRLPYLPSWGPCHLFLLSHPLRTRNEAGCFLPQGPHLALFPRQDSSLLLGGSIVRSSRGLGGHGLQRGTRAVCGQQGRPMPSPAPPAVHTWESVVLCFSREAPPFSARGVVGL